MAYIDLSTRNRDPEGLLPALPRAMLTFELLQDCINRANDGAEGLDIPGGSILDYVTQQLERSRHLAEEFAGLFSELLGQLRDNLGRMC